MTITADRPIETEAETRPMSEPAQHIASPGPVDDSTDRNKSIEQALTYWVTIQFMPKQ